MVVLVDATDSQMAVLADLVESLSAADTTLNAMMAARDGMLALAGRVAVDIARQGDHPDRADMTIRAIAAEIGQRLRVSDRTIERRIGDASWLVDGYPAVWQAQSAGRISSAHAKIIIDAGSHLNDAVRAAYAAAVLPFAEVESPNRLRPIANRIANRFHPRSIDDRHKAARPTRRVWTADADDGMADLHVHAPAVLVHAMMDRLSQMAHRIREENQKAKRDATTAGTPFDADDRTVDEIRADLIADLVLTGTPTGHDTTDGLLAEIRAHIEITVPITTLMNTDLARTSPVEGPDPTGAEWAGTTRSPGEHVVSADGDTEMHPDDNAIANREESRLGAGTEDPGTSSDESCRDGSSDVARRDERSPADSDQNTDRSAPAPPRDADSAPPPPPPALLDGTIPIDTRTARLLAGTATGWDRVLTHPHTGAMLAVDRYRPSEHLRRHLRARDQRCRFPTCGLPARKCDLDHNKDAQFGGATRDDNLAALCRRHHSLKHAAPWHVQQLDDGRLEWTSPAGYTYIDTPPIPHTIVFTEASLSHDSTGVTGTTAQAASATEAEAGAAADAGADAEAASNTATAAANPSFAFGMPADLFDSIRPPF